MKCSSVKRLLSESCSYPADDRPYCLVNAVVDGIAVDLVLANADLVHEAGGRVRTSYLLSFSTAVQLRHSLLLMIGQELMQPDEFNETVERYGRLAPTITDASYLNSRQSLDALLQLC